MKSWIVKLFWNRDQRRLRTLWRLILQMLLAFITGLTLIVAVILLNRLLHFATPDVPDKLLEIVNALGTILAVWLAGRFLDRRRFADFGFHFNRNWWIDLGFGVFLAGGLWTAIFGIGWATGWVKVTGLWVTSDPQDGFLPAILTSAITFLMMGTREELWFRGYQLTNLAEGCHWKFIGPRGASAIALLLSAVLFGWAHVTNANATILSTLSATMGGIILGLGYILTGELALPIGFHVAWNFFQNNVFGFTVSGDYPSTVSIIATQVNGPALWMGDAFGPESGLLAIGAVGLGCLFSVLWVRWRHATTAE